MAIVKGIVGWRGEASEFFEHSYTRKGFFGPYARLYKTRNPGTPMRITGALQPRYFDLQRLVTPDINDNRGLPARILYSEEVSISVSKRRLPMPFCCRNADGDELFFFHKGEFHIDTEFGWMETKPGDFVFIPRNVLYRYEPRTSDNLILIIEASDNFDLADRYHRDHGLTDAALDPSALVFPELSKVEDADGKEHEVVIKYIGGYASIFYDHDPVRVTVGWKGDPIVFKLSAWDVPGARSPFTPPTSAVFMTESKNCVVCIRRPGGGGRASGPPAHSNDYDEIWFYHSASTGEKVGMMKLDPQGLTQAGRRGSSPVAGSAQPDPKRMSLNIDVWRPLRTTLEGESCQQLASGEY